MTILKRENQEQVEIVSNNNKTYELKEIKKSTEFRKHKKHNKFEESKELEEVNESKQSEYVKGSKEVEEPKEAITKESQWTEQVHTIKKSVLYRTSQNGFVEIKKLPDEFKCQKKLILKSTEP